MAELIAEDAERGNARGRASRRRLLDAAAECFGERGYSQTRVADITAAAGMSQGGFYRHFKDKNDILMAALSGPLDLLLATTDPLATRGDGAVSDEAGIVAVTTAFFETYAAHRRVLRVLREAAAVHEPGLAEIWLEVRGRFVDRIVRWLDRLGAGPRADRALLADALGGVLDQTAYTRVALAPERPGAADIATLGRVTGGIWARAVGL